MTERTARSSSTRSSSAEAATIALVVASVLWGTTGTAASFMGDSVSPIAIGASTMALGGLLLFAVSAKAALAALRDRASRGWLLLGAVGVFVYPLAFYSGMSLAGVAIGNVVALGSGPVFAAALEWLFERQRLSRRGAISTAIAVVGVLLLGLFGHAAVRTGGPSGVHGATGEAAGSGGSVGLGLLLGLAAGLAYALYTYSSTRVIRAGHSGRATMGATFGLGAIGLVPVLLVTGGPLLGAPSNLAIAAYLAVGPMFVAYLFFGFGLGSLRSSTVTTITLLEPVVATILAVAVVGERLTITGWAAILIILVGVSVLATARPARKTPH
ncbi:MAG: EamA family transporter [Glaciihabitans sp.]|nr:EamA family transporter [Glaciihabitans sp.]